MRSFHRKKDETKSANFEDFSKFWSKRKGQASLVGFRKQDAEQESRLFVHGRNFYDPLTLVCVFHTAKLLENDASAETY